MATAIYVRDGETIDYTPNAAVAAGDVVVQGDLIGVAKTPIAAGALGSLAVFGVFDFPKSTAGGSAITSGTTLYWDATNKVATATSVGNKQLGKSIRDAADADATVRVRLDGIASVANNPLTANIADPGNAGAIPVTANGNLIGVTKDNVEGVDITVPVYSFSETHYFDDSVVTNTYKGKLFALTGKTNNASFKGCAIGECLFLGASGSKRSGEKWEISFKFAASPNKTGIMVGDKGPANKKGWEYLWVRYAPTVVGGLKVLGQKPVAVYVEKVYEDGNFADLGIGA